MNIEVSEAADGGCRLTVAGEVNIYVAADFRAEVDAKMAGCSALEMDLSGVSELDTTGVQILMAAKRQCQAEDRELRLVAHSPAVLDVFELYGLDRFFGDPLLLAGEDGTVTEDRHE
mgnify:CR=1 FL=1